MEERPISKIAALLVGARRETRPITSNVERWASGQSAAALRASSFVKKSSAPGASFFGRASAAAHRHYIAIGLHLGPFAV
jgi:hypothetical protein